MKNKKCLFVKGLLSVMMVLFVFGCKKTDGGKMAQNEIGKYDLVVTGYDWGPGTDRIIIHAGKEYKAEKIKAEDFTVIVEAMVLNWANFQMKNSAGYRKIISAYPEGTDIILELEVDPEDPYSNPFIFNSSMMNTWQPVYNVRIKNEKLKLEVTELNKKISPLADKFSFASSTYNDITLQYAWWKPENDTKKPLIIWLHGMGEGGTDPYITLLGNKVVNLITDDVQKCFGETGAYVLAPQADGFWMQTTEKKDTMASWVSDTSKLVKSYYTEALFNLIDNFVKAHEDIDPAHIYIGGCSNGGYMTMNMLIEYPGYFAAAYPVCEAYPDSRITEEKLEKLAGQSIWFTQSLDDKTVNPDNYVLPTYKRLEEKKAKDIHITLWDNVTDSTGRFYKNDRPYKFNGHWSWIYTLNNQCREGELSIFEWLAKH